MKTEGHFDHIAIIYSWNKNVSDRSCTENQNIFYPKGFFCLFLEIMPIVR